MAQSPAMPASFCGLKSSAAVNTPNDKNIILDPYKYTPKELRLMKNRIAARECRKKKKEYIKNLENHVIKLEKENDAMRTEIKLLQSRFMQ